MQRMKTWRWVSAALLLVIGVMAARGEDLRIQSFDGTGQLSFNRVSTATVYRVEWATSPSGPWTNFTGAAAVLDNIAQFATDSYTCSVPMCYRVVAQVTNAPAIPTVPDGMVQIPSGVNSGTEPDWGAYSVTNIMAFYMDTTEVTKAKWDEVYIWAVANGYSFTNAGLGKASNHPVHTVNWYDCVKWCNARSEKEGRTPCYNVSGSVYKTGQKSPTCNFSVNGYRLPTINERVFAAHGGLSSTRFHWGNTIQHSRANYYSWGTSSFSYDTSPTSGYHPTYATGGVPYTSPVGALVANGYGLYDMSGNVWEWQWDAIDMYRSYGGGGWESSAYNLTFHGSRALPDELYRCFNNVGFRAVCR